MRSPKESDRINLGRVWRWQNKEEKQLGKQKDVNLSKHKDRSFSICRYLILLSFSLDEIGSHNPVLTKHLEFSSMCQYLVLILETPRTDSNLVSSSWPQIYWIHFGCLENTPINWASQESFSQICLQTLSPALKPI